MFKKDTRISILSFAPRRTKRSNLLKLNLFAFTYLSLIGSLCALYIFAIPQGQATPEKRTLGEKTNNIQKANLGYLRISPKPTTVIISTPTATPEPPLTPTPTTEPKPSNETSDTTKTITNVDNDDSMATVGEIFSALNTYRNEYGAGALLWDDTLAQFANSRVDTFSSLGALDSHAGFKSYMDSNGFEASGFNGLGENSARLSGPMHADKIIRDIYGQSEAHNKSQLDPAWTHAGVAIKGNFVNINFGKNKR